MGNWFRPLGRALERGEHNTFDHCVTGAPCIVWDEAGSRWQMYYFAAGNQMGTAGLDIGMAVSKSEWEVGAGCWEKLGRVPFTNPEDVWQDGALVPLRASRSESRSQ